MKCQCEHSSHYPDNDFETDGHGCQSIAIKVIDTIYGQYHLCPECANESPCKLPEDLLK